MSHTRLEIYDPFADLEKPSRCIKFLRLLWKFSRCVFSHVTLVSLVVAYCVIGAYAFESLEADHEKQIKKNVKYLRGNITEKLWKLTKEVEVLVRENWTLDALRELQGFESNLFTLLRKEGWDGSEEENNIQWTFAGALFYSIIVITTIGYGHIAPKTKNGKVVTIFYAVVGIPLMLLCLSNIGDVMASSFRFLYWKVCCYVCTKPPKKRRSRPSLVRSYSARQSGRYDINNRAASFRRSIRLSQRSTDGTLGIPEGLTRTSYSDTDCRDNSRRSNGMDQRRIYSYQLSSPTALRPTTSFRNTDIPLSSLKLTKGNPRLGTQSLDRRLTSGTIETDHSPVLCNKYALDDVEDDLFLWQSTSRNKPEYVSKFGNRAQVEDKLEDIERQPTSITRSLPRRFHSVESAILPPQRSTLSTPYQLSSGHLSGIEQNRRYYSERIRRSPSNYSNARFHRREASLPRILSPIGFAMHRRACTDDIDVDYEFYTTTDEQERQPIKPVPIWLCIFLVVSYILGGACLFSKWEKWTFLDSAYFCFITLTTIGFGDFVPNKLDAHKGIALCSLYLLFGIALLAMSFNLVQEEVINNVKSIAKSLGILKDSDDEYDEDDDDDEDDYRYDAEYEDDVDEDDFEERCDNSQRKSSYLDERRY
ncbi:uncharacterized protein LOC118447656 isoform X1 [Vespa mandarinia]|uniref:uncharacterized protein LOC118447656 isoform X1 n=1 Tax=Vespa mandarinia TaxID=7446 RepID=UPI00161E2201|nr:uncharacterized protein LOC118447656 isoform X1 [Vespa mandarinia]XP_035735743.1 uncharacterized protein LOC118447656 isoform X1 [Vespa mandarinia]XP_035735744.1 uncharacterized protein LOC118447656 isoform X1 [Vespa mandarinia]XP_035735745.1 uncharacterized protein LOC118447656 isoform X1 [Vespa mandarinia]XP_035735746.1 uncharacterized protein LOC118447656 isoform X1 [Vespa mandarinia]